MHLEIGDAIENSYHFEPGATEMLYRACAAPVTAFEMPASS
jgi:hypothetical protein